MKEKDEGRGREKGKLLLLQISKHIFEGEMTIHGEGNKDQTSRRDNHMQENLQ